MKKMLLALLLLVTAQTQAQTRKCDWSGYWMKKVYQSQNYFQFQTNLGDWGDTCIEYTWLVYDYQLKRVDTLSDTRGITQVQFNAKGKYKLGIHAVDKCNKCDTNFFEIIDITIYGSKAKFSYTPNIKDCKSVTFEIAKIDTCMNYYYEIWNANEFSKNMTDKQWKEVSDSLLYFTYGWEEKNLVYYSQASERALKHDFADSGRYIVTTYWQNKCTGIDTWAWNKIVVCPKEQQTTSVKTLIKTPKVIGYYDMMGRKVDAIEPNQIYIILYDNNQRRKVMQVK